MSTTKPTLFIATESKICDISPWANEGYDIHLLTEATSRDIENAVDDLESNDKYAIIAFGTAASAALHFAVHPSRQLQAVAAYYPPTLPSTHFHPEVRILIHLPASSPFSIHTGPTLRIRLYDCAPGFVEPQSPTYDRLAAGLAFSRTLALLRYTIGPEDVDLESIWDEHMLYEFTDKDVDKTLSTMVSNPCVNHVPVMTGGMGYDNLYRFYKDYFIPNNPPNMCMTLVSRTVGSDRIVDEMVATFTHTCEMPWMLPGVPPTYKDVEIALVTVICIRGGKLFHEHIYWDQASVLVQLGLLDKAVLPVTGAESARKVLDDGSIPSNGLIKDW